MDDASALAESLQDVALVPETTVQSVPDVTMSLLVDQKVPTDSHPTRGKETQLYNTARVCVLASAAAEGTRYKTI